MVQVIKIGEGAHESGLVLGEIVMAHVRDDIINGHRINHHMLKPTGRLAGNMYCRTNDRFEMVRPVYDPERSAVANR